jgi:hypothetical protein
MAFLTRDEILSAEDRSYDTVECPEWGGTVRLRSISGRQRDLYEQSMVEQKGSDRKVNVVNARAKLIVLCAVDGDGRPLFTSEDLRQLSAKNAKPLDRLFAACQRLAGLSDDDVKALTENFDETPDDGSTSD